MDRYVSMYIADHNPTLEAFDSIFQFARGTRFRFNYVCLAGRYNVFARCSHIQQHWSNNRGSFPAVELMMAARCLYMCRCVKRRCCGSSCFSPILRTYWGQDRQMANLRDYDYTLMDPCQGQVQERCTDQHLVRSRLRNE